MSHTSTLVPIEWFCYALVIGAIIIVLLILYIVVLHFAIGRMTRVLRLVEEAIPQAFTIQRREELRRRVRSVLDN